MKKIFCLIGIMVAFSSCSDFLEETNRNSITGDVLYNTPEGYESLVNACYAYSRAWFGKPEGYAFTELGTDCYTGVELIVVVRLLWHFILKTCKAIRI